MTRSRLGRRQSKWRVLRSRFLALSDLRQVGRRSPKLISRARSILEILSSSTAGSSAVGAKRTAKADVKQASETTARGCALRNVNWRRIPPVLSPNVRHQPRQPSASRSAARCRRGVWRHSCRGLARRLRQGDTLKDLPDRTWACTAVSPPEIALASIRSRNIVRESPGVSASIAICRTIASSPCRCGEERLRRSRCKVEPRSVSGQALSATAHKQGTRGCPSSVEMQLPMRRFSSRPRVGTAIPRRRGQRRREAS